MLGRSLVVVDLGAELRSVAKDRLELGGDRRVVGASEDGRSKRRRCRSGEKLNDKRESDDESGQGRTQTPRAKTRPTHPPFLFGAPAVHNDSLLF